MPVGVPNPFSESIASLGGYLFLKPKRRNEMLFWILVIIGILILLNALEMWVTGK